MNPEFAWPISDHQLPDGHPGGSAIPFQGELKSTVDEGWKVQMLILDLDSNEHQINLKTENDWKYINFSCRKYN